MLLSIALAACHVIAFQVVETAPGTLEQNLAPPTPCGMCHSNGEKTLSYDTYRGSPMFLASVDPVFTAAHEVALEDDEDGAGLCIKCHFPSGWLAGRGSPSDGSALSVADKHGLSCDLCHRMLPPPRAEADLDGGVLDGGADAGLAPFALPLENGFFAMHDGTTKYGPFDDPAPTTNHESEYSTYLHSSAMCGTCHNVTNPSKTRKDPDTGESLGYAMPEQRTFTEWQNSDFADVNSPQAKTCQECHMPAFTGLATAENSTVERTLRSHRIVGGNPVMPRLVAALPGGPGVPEYLSGIDDDAELAALAAEQLLQEESATLEVTAASAEDHNVSVRVTNKTGHKLPTGYAEGRRMWLGHTVSYGDGSAGPQTGATGASGDLVGTPPVKTWEILLADPTGQVTFRFLTADRIVKDNRIPPQGFRPTPDTAPVQADFSPLPSGALPHFDDATLSLGTPPCYPVRAQMTLYYQPITPAYKSFLADAAPQSGAALAAAWTTAAQGAPIAMQNVDVLIDEDGNVTPFAGSFACTATPPPADAGPIRIDAGPAAPDAGDTPEPAPQPEPEASPEPEPEPGCTCHSSTDAPATPLAAGGLMALAAWAWRRGRRAPRRSRRPTTPAAPR